MQEAREILKRVYGDDDFRSGQTEAVSAAVTGADVQVLLPTGSGKSLCYQVPARVASHQGRGTTIVVSPLIALMHDQVNQLEARGVAAAALNSHQSSEESGEVVIASLKSTRRDRQEQREEQAARPDRRRGEAPGRQP